MCIQLKKKDMNEKLLPCPFCGSIHVELQNTWTPAYSVECENCGAEVYGNAFSPSPADILESVRYYDKEKNHRIAALSAINMWNKRVKNNA